MEDCPTLITRLCDKGILQTPSTQNLQMMRSELCEEDPNVSIMFQSDIMTGDDKGKQLKESAWVHKASTKELEFDLEHIKETFMEVKKSFMETSTSGNKDQLELEMDLSMLTTFLQTCMKLLHDSKVVKRL